MKKESRFIKLKLLLLIACLFLLATHLVLISSAQRSPAKSAGDVKGEVERALRELPSARVVIRAADGVPTFIKGDLARVQATGGGATVDLLRPALARIAPVFLLNSDNLIPVSVRQDALNMTHVKYRQIKNGLEVIGGDLIVHVNAEGVVYAANGTARDGFDIDSGPTLSAEDAQSSALRAYENKVVKTGAPRLKYLIKSERRAMHLTYEMLVEGSDPDGRPVRDLVYIDANDGNVMATHPKIYHALNRQISSSDGSCNIPGELQRSEGGPPVSDSDVNAVYDNLGITYNAYLSLFGRDSFDGQGAPILSTVNYCGSINVAFWDGQNIVFADFAGVSQGDCLDIVSHEYTHAVTEFSSGLIYQGESGALNEAWSDIFGAVVEAHNNGLSENTWKVSEGCTTPGIDGDALRYMNNPTQDGISADYYPEHADFNVEFDSGNVHRNSGIANLAFYLLAMGGQHPRIMNNITVTGIGISAAQQIFYRANEYYLIPNSRFSDARAATAQAAQDLYGESVASIVHAAWDAVDVPPVEFDSDFVSQSAPTTLVTGEIAAVSITMRNTGSEPWDPSEEPPRFFLQSENMTRNQTWGLPFTPLIEYIPSGGEVTFTFNITAPATPGNYNFQWRMWDNRSGSEGFGDFTDNVVINVVNPPGQYDIATFVSQSVPITMTPGGTYVVSVVMKNIGSTTWSNAGGYSLGSQNPDNNTTWGLSQVNMTTNVAPAQQSNFSFFVTAPNTPGTYNFQWRLRKGLNGWFGPASPNVVVSVDTATSAPTDLVATAISNSQINLSWNDNSSNESGFKIERKIGAGSFTQIATVGVNVTNYSDIQVAPSTSYTYRVRAFNANGNSGYSNEASATTPGQPPAAPSTLNMFATSCTIDIWWSDNSSDESGFIVERLTGGQSPYYEQIATTGPDESWSTDPGPFQLYTYYYYRVRSYNAAGASAPSNAVSKYWTHQCSAGLVTDSSTLTVAASNEVRQTIRTGRPDNVNEVERNADEELDFDILHKGDSVSGTNQAGNSPSRLRLTADRGRSAFLSRVIAHNALRSPHPDGPGSMSQSRILPLRWGKKAYRC